MHRGHDSSVRYMKAGDLRGVRSLRHREARVAHLVSLGMPKMPGRVLLPGKSSFMSRDAVLENGYAGCFGEEQ